MLKYADCPEHLVLLAQQILSTEKVEEIIKLSDDWFVHKYHIINLKNELHFQEKNSDRLVHFYYCTWTKTHLETNKATSIT